MMDKETQEMVELYQNFYLLHLPGKMTRYIHDQAKKNGMGSTQYIEKLITDDMEAKKQNEN